MAKFGFGKRGDDSGMKISSKSSLKARKAKEQFRAKTSQVVGLARVSDFRGSAKNIPWYISGPGAAASVVLVSLMAILIFSVIAWLPYSEYTESVPFAVSGHIWLLVTGVPIGLEAGQMSLFPLLLTILLFVLSHVACQLVFPRTLGSNELSDDDKKMRFVVKLTGGFALTYAAIGLLVLALSGQASWGALLRLAIVGVLLSFFSLKHAAHWSIVPRVIRDLGWAVLSGLFTLLFFSCLALIAALIGGREKIATIAASLGAGGLDSVLLALTQLAWLPNALIWMMSWVSGAGFSFGADSVITPAATEVGLLPALPLLGAFPDPGGTPAGFSAWLVAPVLAGAVCGYVFIRRQMKQVDCLFSAAVWGAVAGIFAGMALVVLGYLSSGDLGGVRLVDVGPRLPELATFAPALLGLGSLCASTLTASLLGVRRILPKVQVAKPTELPEESSDG